MGLGYGYPGLCARFGEMAMFKTAGILGMSFNTVAVCINQGIGEQSSPYIALGALMGLVGGISGFAASKVLHAEMNTAMMERNVGINRGTRTVRAAQVGVYSCCLLLSTALSLWCMPRNIELVSDAPNSAAARANLSPP